MKNCSLVLSDLDGTLFRDDKSVSEYTKKTIVRLQEKGILFGIATSRALVNAEKFLDGIKPDVLITNGGALAFFRGQKIYNCEFTVNETRKIINTAFEFLGDDAVISVDNENSLYSNSKEELGDKFWIFNDFSDFNEPAMKICFKTQNEKAIKKISSVLGNDKVDVLPFSDIPWFKMTKADATKENAIEAMCDFLGIQVSKVVSFGDDFNDIGMLKMCGRGIAMKNAIDMVKNAADEITLTNQEDGVAVWIEKNLLH